jgi:hypothetical protein
MKAKMGKDVLVSSKDLEVIVWISCFYVFTKAQRISSPFEGGRGMTRSVEEQSASKTKQIRMILGNENLQEISSPYPLQRGTICVTSPQGENPFPPKPSLTETGFTFQARFTYLRTLVSAFGMNETSKTYYDSV